MAAWHTCAKYMCWWFYNESARWWRSTWSTGSDILQKHMGNILGRSDCQYLTTFFFIKHMNTINESISYSICLPNQLWLYIQLWAIKQDFITARYNDGFNIGRSGRFPVLIFSFPLKFFKWLFEKLTSDSKWEELGYTRTHLWFNLCMSQCMCSIHFTHYILL